MYIKKEFASEKTAKIYPLREKKGKRGNYDFAIINPEYINSTDGIENIINKNISFLESRVLNDRNSINNELLFTIEFKYITSNGESWIRQIKMDNNKLLYSKEWGSREAINLIFCNLDYYYKKRLNRVIIGSPIAVNAILAVSYYKDGRKITPKNLTNNPNDMENKNIPVIS